MTVELLSSFLSLGAGVFGTMASVMLFYAARKSNSTQDIVTAVQQLKIIWAQKSNQDQDTDKSFFKIDLDIIEQYIKDRRTARVWEVSSAICFGITFLLIIAQGIIELVSKA